MTRPAKYRLLPGWRIVCVNLGISPATVLRRARLAEGLLRREEIDLSAAQYFALVDALESEADDPEFPLKLGLAVTVEAFNPPLFAALCSPDLMTALDRLGTYKRLVGPMTMGVTTAAGHVGVSLGSAEPDVPLPRAMALAEIVFLVKLARDATKEPVTPLAVHVPEVPGNVGEIERFLGVALTPGHPYGVRIAMADARRPFLTENAEIWRSFEPELSRRLAALDDEASITDWVHAALLELLPSGRPAMEDVARKLAMSTRSLQRRLSEEDSSFQTVLVGTRLRLAKHYLAEHNLTGPEIAFLLGYRDPNSFIRAFHGWAGQTPEAFRSAARAQR